MKKYSKIIGISCLALGLLFNACEAQAQVNLVSNGSFDINLSGWTYSSSASIYYYRGTAGFEAVNRTGDLSQILSTLPGADYQLSFNLSGNARPVSNFEVLWNGSSVFKTMNDANFQPLYSFTVHATSPTTTLIFRGRNDPSSYFLDNVAVTPIIAVSPVPEPETYALLLAGLGVMGAIARRRARHRATHAA